MNDVTANDSNDKSIGIVAGAFMAMGVALGAILITTIKIYCKIS